MIGGGLPNGVPGEAGVQPRLATHHALQHEALVADDDARRHVVHQGRVLRRREGEGGE